MTPAELARLHGLCFSTPRPWSEREFAALLAGTGTFLISVPQGFALGRAIAGEAELLTLAVAPQARRQGTGRHLLNQFLQAARQRSADSAFLEVAADNAAALALYAAAGFVQTGRRRGYYTAPDGAKTDALLLCCALAPPPPVS